VCAALYSISICTVVVGSLKFEGVYPKNSGGRTQSVSKTGMCPVLMKKLARIMRTLYITYSQVLERQTS